MIFTLFYSDKFVGTIPPSLASTPVKHVLLSANKLSGPLPELDTFTTSLELNFDYNDLTGSLPSSVNSLVANLTALSLSYNKLNGTIPPELGTLSNLQFLSLSYNEISGGFTCLIECC